MPHIGEFINIIIYYNCRLIVVPVGSPCYGMSSTCCLSNEEKGMEPIVALEYHQLLQSVLENGLSSCNRLGRDMESESVRHTSPMQYNAVFMPYTVHRQHVMGVGIDTHYRSPVISGYMVDQCVYCSVRCTSLVYYPFQVS